MAVGKANFGGATRSKGVTGIMNKDSLQMNYRHDTYAKLREYNVRCAGLYQIKVGAGQEFNGQTVSVDIRVNGVSKNIQSFNTIGSAMTAVQLDVPPNAYIQIFMKSTNSTISYFTIYGVEITNDLVLQTV